MRHAKNIMINRSNWLQFEHWYFGLSKVQRVLFYVGLGLLCFIFIAIITHEPRERPRYPKIILDCNPGCGVDPERAISYNDYMDRKDREQKSWLREEKKRIQQENWDENGRARWCRNHPQDRNCR